MFRHQKFGILAVGVMAVSWLGLLSMPERPVLAQSSRPQLRGGATGVVSGSQGQPLEGIGVQLIAARTAIRTTVYTNEDGEYEFPVLDTGQYTFRVALPREYKPWVKEAVQIDRGTKLPDITLDRISNTEFLPPTPEILAQLTGAEWMLNLPGTGEEKRVFSLTCGFGCHSYQQIFRNRYDEQSWRLIVQRMMRGNGSPLINVRNLNASSRDRAARPTIEDEELLANWLGRVRGPGVKDSPVHYLPRLRGASTRVVVTEYELPRQLLAPHDVHGDALGNIWYTAHRSPYAGVLDPRTGKVTEVRIPEKERDTKGALPGTHRVWVQGDIAWFSEQWDHYLTGVDVRTKKIVARHDFSSMNERNSTGMSNFALDDNGFFYETFENAVIKGDTKTGKVVRKYPLTQRVRNAYESIVTPDGRWWSGGDIGGQEIALLNLETGEYVELESRTPVISPSRGGFDRDGYAWWGGRGGMLFKVDVKKRRVTEYYPPVAYETFYEAMPDKNGEIWAGGLQGGVFYRFNPRNEQWVVYPMPEPYSHDRRTWIDNSTDPVAIWYTDQNGYIARVQPLDTVPGTAPSQAAR